jgi:uncharacterized protein YjbI with pentapeptide repeats
MGIKIMLLKYKQIDLKQKIWILLKKAKGIVKNLFNANTIIYILLFLICFFFVVIHSVSKGYFNKPDFQEGITIEAFGMLFDILVLGVIFSILCKFIENRQDIKRHLEEIDDFRGWNEKEAMYRNVGNIKRLIKLGVTGKKLNLGWCYLKGAVLKDANLEGANLEGANLEGAKLCRAKLNGANLNEANLNGADLAEANLKGAFLLGTQLFKTNLARANLIEITWESTNIGKAYLREARMEGADLSGIFMNGAKLIEANLKGAILKGTFLEGAVLIDANLEGANLEGANLEGANLWDVNNLTVEQLLKVKSLYKVENLDPKIETELIERKPDLFKKPED